MACARSPALRCLASPASSAAAGCLTTTRGLRTKAVAAGGRGKKPPRPMRTIEGMPFQTYQLALEVIRKDREEKIADIKTATARLNRLVASTPNIDPKNRMLLSMQRRLEWLKVQADINNPRVKYNFDRGMIDMHKPVYRFLLDRKWREYRRPVLMQRITQMNVIPDVLPYIDPVVDVQVRFHGKDIQPGAFLKSSETERAPTFKVIQFEPGEKLCTVAVIDADVPVVEKDGFDYRLHWLVSNIPVSLTTQQAMGTGAKRSDEIVPWLPPHVQKGSPYHRYAMFVFQQPGKIDVEPLKGKIERDGFIMRSFQAKQKLEPIGCFMFRGEYDEYTKDIMQKHGLPGWDRMFVRPTKSIMGKINSGKVEANVGAVRA